MSKISIIIPCFNEQEVIPIFYKKIKQTAEEIPAEFEYIFVDDGSTDSTLQILKQLAALDETVRYISFSRNFGKESSICAGLRSFRGDYAAVMDVDLQDPPDLLKEMFNILEHDANCDCVATRRTTRQGEPALRSAFSKAFYLFANKISDVQMKSGERDFRMMRRKMAQTVAEMSERSRFSKGLFDWVGFQTRWLEFENVQRTAGTTKWSFLALARYAAEGIIGFSTKPLSIPYICAAFSALTAIGLLIAITIRAIMRLPVSATLTISLVLFLITAAITLCIGVACSYILRIYKESKQRPIYIISEESK